jgi:CheY-like chemotaxis protein
VVEEVVVADPAVAHSGFLTAVEEEGLMADDAPDIACWGSLMNTRPKPQILCVDDEPRVVQGLAQLLRKEFDVQSAASPEEALQRLGELKELAVVVSDMRMPRMDGATLLHEIRMRRPDVTRILLTGEAGRDAAIRAVNEGQIFRFLTKPCPIEDLREAIEAGVIQNRLTHAERAVLQETLIGCIKALMEVLAMANPVAFGRAKRIKRTAMKCAARFGCGEFWQLEAAALLSQLGYVTVPQALLEKLYAGDPLTPQERQKLDDVPDVSNALLEHIPRLEPVIQILAALKWDDAALARLGDGTIGLAARILGAVIERETQFAGGKSRAEILSHMHARRDRYGEKLLMQLDACVSDPAGAPAARAPTEREMLLSDVMPGMTICTELRNENGVLLVPKNFEVTKKFIDRISSIAPELMMTTVKVLTSPRP